MQKFTVSMCCVVGLKGAPGDMGLPGGPGLRGGAGGSGYPGIKGAYPRF